MFFWDLSPGFHRARTWQLLLIYLFIHSWNKYCVSCVTGTWYTSGHQWRNRNPYPQEAHLCWFLFCLKFLWYIISFHVLFKMRLFSYIFSVFSSDSFYLSVVSRIYWPGYLDTHFPSLFAHHTIYCFTRSSE